MLPQQYTILMESRFKGFFLFTALVALCALVIFSHLCSSHSCSLHRHFTVISEFKMTDLHDFFLPKIPNGLYHSGDEPESMDVFNMSGVDTIVYIHIQKTGGTEFGRHLVRDIRLEKPCICANSTNGSREKLRGGNSRRRRRRRKKKKLPKKCDCYRPGSQKKRYWLFSRFSTGWRCGLHADWTELTACVDDWLNAKEHQQVDRRYFYITVLREPIARYLSEFKHVQRGATWRGSKLLCNNKPATPEQVPLCYNGSDWKDVSLDEFIACKSNLAINRQTRMLADLTKVGCYDGILMPTEERNRILLESAKDNLRDMVFFGLTEYQQPSQYMFERTFNLTFMKLFEQHDTRSSSLHISAQQHEQVKALNNLDRKLYAFAKSLFFERYQHFKELYPEDFEDAYDTSVLGAEPGDDVKQKTDAYKQISAVMEETENVQVLKNGETTDHPS